MIAIYRLGEGVQAFPCSENLAFGCQARGAFPFPVPKRCSNKDYSSQFFPFPIICRPHLYTAPVVAARTRPVAAAGCIGSHLNDLSLILLLGCKFPKSLSKLPPDFNTSFRCSGCRRRRLRGRGLRRRLAPRRSLLILPLSHPPSVKNPFLLLLSSEALRLKNNSLLQAACLREPQSQSLPWMIYRMICCC